MSTPPSGSSAGPGLLHAMWRFRALVLVLTVAGAVIGLGLSALQPTRYTATTQVLLLDPRSNDVFGTRPAADPTRRTLDAGRQMESEPVLQRASGQLANRLTVDQLADQVSVEPAAELSLVSVRAMDSTAEGAAEIANAVRDAYGQDVLEAAQADIGRIDTELESYRAELRAQVEQAQAELAALRAEVEASIGSGFPSADARSNAVERTIRNDPRTRPLELRRDSALNNLNTVQREADQQRIDLAALGTGYQVVVPAEVPSAPSQPRPVRNGAIAAMIGVLAGAGWAWRRAERAPEVRSSSEVAALLGVPQLGEIPRARSGLGSRGPGRTRTNALRAVAAATAREIERSGASSALVTGVRPADETSLTALYLAERCMAHGATVVVVDADLARRTLTEVAGRETEPGFFDWTNRRPRPSPGPTAVNLDSSGGIELVPAGSALPSDGLTTAALREALAALTSYSDVVLLDGPPLVDGAEGFELGGIAAAIVLVVPDGVSVDELHELRGRLTLLRTPVLGYILYEGGERRHGRRARLEMKRAINLVGWSPAHPECNADRQAEMTYSQARR